MRFKNLLILSIYIFLCHSMWGAPKLSKEECLPIVMELQAISNSSPKEIEGKAPKALERLQNGESMTYYFIAYNIYVENLFNQGKIEKANKELDAMINEAMSQEDLECQVIALRAQGQFYYKLGLYNQAVESFAKAMDICPRYDSPKLESYFTWSSTLFWLAHSYLQTGCIDQASQLLSQMDKMMLWLEKNGEVDEIGYKPVMINGLKAKIALQRGDIATARAMLENCIEYMNPDVPRRAYIDYYEAEMLLAVSENRLEDAIPMLDDLIEMHISDYKPIAANFLCQKANILYDLGRYQESAQTFQKYEALQAQADEISIAQQLDELRTRYDVEKLQHERDQMHNNLILAIIICIALLVITAIVILSQKRLKQKNKVLAQSISDLHQLSKPRENASNNMASDEEAPNPEYVAIGNSIVDYIKSSKCFLNANCGRQTIKDAIGVSEQLVSKALPVVTGMTFVNYINRLRLDAAIDLLENHQDITIIKISTMCGFGTLRQFQRIFKQHYDLSPSEYREARNATPPKNEQ